MYTHLEDYIQNLYNSIGVTDPRELDVLQIAKKVGVEVTYRKSVFRFDNEIVLVRGTKVEEWMDFGHEICHFLRHCGSQLKMHPLFIDLQEYQANYFSYHFCVPTFMLDQLQGVTVQGIMSLFNVEYSFACRRLEMYRNKFYSGGCIGWM